MRNNPTSFDYQKRNMDLTKAQFDLANNSPNQSEPFVDAVNDFSKINQRKKSGLQAGIEGLASGLKYGSKRGEVDRKQQLFDFLEGNIMAMRQRSDRLEKQQQFLENTTPYATTLYDISNNKHLGDDEKQKYISDIVRQYQQVNPEAGKFDIISAPAGQDFFVAIDRATGEKSINTYQSLMTKDAWSDLQRRNLENLKMGIQQQNADAYGRSVNSNVALHNAQIDQMPETLDVRKQEANNAARRLDNETGKNIEKSFAEPIKATQSFIKDADRIDAIVTNNKGIFQSLSAIQWGNESPGYFETIRRDLQTKFDPATANSIGSLIKYINKMTIDVAKGFKRPNMFIEKIGSKAVPNLNMSPDSFKKVLAEMKQDAEIDLKNYKRHVETFDTTNDKKYYNSYFPADENTAPQGAGEIKVKAPDGKIWNSDIEKYNSLPPEIRNQLQLVN